MDFNSSCHGFMNLSFHSFSSFSFIFACFFFLSFLDPFFPPFRSLLSFFLFFLSFLPSFFFSHTGETWTEKEIDYDRSITYMVVSTLDTFNHAGNFLLYIISGQKFRQWFLEVVTCRPEAERRHSVMRSSGWRDSQASEKRPTISDGKTQDACSTIAQKI